ncbi:hypothetical protein LWI28_016799 [Acer negundo]|uniref:Uncharacterized protein n=1 Tax=Acer negundo TaxID=4023 RepID=A0AAD5NXM4_ACENE|nr:hypothetical protein LWI28_016799 [Acer negundo]
MHRVSDERCWWVGLELDRQVESNEIGRRVERASSWNYARHYRSYHCYARVIKIGTLDVLGTTFATAPTYNKNQANENNRNLIIIKIPTMIAG